MIINGVDLSQLEAQLAPQNSGKILLYDADFCVYKAAATVKRLDTAIRRFYQLVLEDMFLVGCSEAVAYLTPAGCAKCLRWHLPTAKPYQGQRANRQELPLKAPLKRHLIENPDQYSEQGIQIVSSDYFEADDLFVMDSYSFGDRGILMSQDKDSWLSPMARFDIPTGTVWPALDNPFGWIKWDDTQAMPVRAHGLKFFWWQMLAGDDADNVKGITLLDGKLCGKRTAFDAIYPITSEQDAAEFVVAAYARNNQDVLAEAECLWLRRSQSDSAYLYLMSLLTTPSLRDWVHSLHEYHKQHIQWIQEHPDNGEDVCEGNEPAGD